MTGAAAACAPTGEAAEPSSACGWTVTCVAGCLSPPKPRELQPARRAISDAEKRRRETLPDTIIPPSARYAFFIDPARSAGPFMTLGDGLYQPCYEKSIG